MVKGEILPSQVSFTAFVGKCSYVNMEPFSTQAACRTTLHKTCIRQVDLLIQVEGQAIFFSRTHIPHLFTHTYTLKKLITDLACQNEILTKNQAAPLCLQDSDLTECFNLLLNHQCPL